MTRGRPRRRDATIPAHVDQAKLPRGVYWDPRRRTWYVRAFDDVGRHTRRTVGTDKARLSDLHAAAEALRANEAERGTVDYVLQQFHASTRFAELADGTRKHYEYVRGVVSRYPTKAGPLGRVLVSRISAPVVQTIVEHVAKAGHRTKANHILRYLRRALRWGVNHGACATNPAEGVKQVKERKLRRLPSLELVARVRAFAEARGARPSRSAGAVPSYLWMLLEIGHRCRLRGIESLTLTDAHATDVGLVSNRRKGSRDNVTEWCPSLRVAWQAALERRAAIVARRRLPVPLRPEARPVFLADSGEPLSKSGLDTAWQRFMALAVKEGILTAEERFGLHDMKRRGITDTAGTRADKQQASGHKSAAMVDVYDQSLPRVKPAGEE
jgi:site-specific recombinase XerC